MNPEDHNPLHTLNFDGQLVVLLLPFAKFSYNDQRVFCDCICTYKIDLSLRSMRTLLESQWLIQEYGPDDLLNLEQAMER